MDKEKRKGKGKDLFGRFLTATEDGCVSSAGFDETSGITLRKTVQMLQAQNH